MQRARFKYPALNEIKINPIDEIKRQVRVNKKSFTLDIKSESRKELLKPDVEEVGCCTEICDLSMTIIEEYKTKKRTLRVPRVNAAT